MRRFASNADLLIRMSVWAVVIAASLIAIAPDLLRLPDEAMIAVVTPLLYLMLSLGITVWVARSLRPAWMPFIQRKFGGDLELATLATHTLATMVVLMGFGLAAMILPSGVGEHLQTLRLEAVEMAQTRGVPIAIVSMGDTPFEILATSLGKVLIVLGVISALVTRYCVRQPPRMPTLDYPDLATLPEPPPRADAAPRTAMHGTAPLTW